MLYLPTTKKTTSESIERRGDIMLPYLSEVQNASKKYGVVFRGINYGEGTQDGEFAETHNLSTEQYPCITQRAERIKVKEYNNPSTLHSKGDLLVIDGDGTVWYGENKVGEVEAGKKQTATIGNYIVIVPDKQYYKVPTPDENGEMQDGEFGSMDIEYKEHWLNFTKSTISILNESSFLQHYRHHLPHVFRDSSRNRSGLHTQYSCSAAK